MLCPFTFRKVQERQALANEFAKLGAEKIGDIAKEKNWSPNDPRHSLLHGLLGGISAKLGGNSILSGAASGATMEGLQPILNTFLKDHQEMREEVSSLIGYTTGKLLGGDGETGSTVAWNGTKFNWLNGIICWNRKCVKTAKNLIPRSEAQAPCPPTDRHPPHNKNTSL